MTEPPKRSAAGRAQRNPATSKRTRAEADPYAKLRAAMWAGPGAMDSEPRAFKLNGAIPLSKLSDHDAAFVFKLEPELLAALQADIEMIRPCDPSAGAFDSADAASDAAGPAWSMLGGTKPVTVPTKNDDDGDNGAHLLDDSDPKSATLTISPGMAAPYVYVDLSHGASPGGPDPISQLHRAIAAAVQQRMPRLFGDVEFEIGRAAGAYALGYGRGMGTGAIHFDSEKGQAAAVVVCLEAPPRDGHSCAHCRGRKQARTLLNMCIPGDVYNRPPLRTHSKRQKGARKKRAQHCNPISPVAVELAAGDVLVFCNFDSSGGRRDGDNLQSGWHTGETVLCHRKIVLSIGLYRKDRLNHFDRKFGYVCTTPAVTAEIRSELPPHVLAVLPNEMPPGPKKDYRPLAAAIEAMRWTTDDNQLPPGTRRVYKSKAAYEAALGRRRILLSDFTAV